MTLIEGLASVREANDCRAFIDAGPYARFLGLTAAMLSARGAAVDTHARGIVTRHGRRVTNVRMEAWQADRNAPVATAHGIFLVMRS